MSTDDFDNIPSKTVFRQAGDNSNFTVMKPVPGGRIQNPFSDNSSPLSSPVSSVIPDLNAVDIDQCYYTATRGLNPLVNAASVLLAVYEKTRIATSHHDITGLHQHLVNEIKLFEKHAKQQSISSEIVLSARYILCTILDEAVLNTPWGCESAWNQRTLLSTFHNEASGGEKFFTLLDRLRESPTENIFIIELFYLCLSLGFVGKYQLSDRGDEKIKNIRNELFSLIRTHRGEFERELSPCWQGVGHLSNSITHYIPIWVVASIVAGLLFLSYSGFRYWLYSSSGSMVNDFETISKPYINKKRNKF